MIDSLRSRLLIRKMRIMIIAERVSEFPYDDVEILKAYPYGLLEMADCVLTSISLGKVSMTDGGREFLEAVDDADVIVHAPGGPSIGDIYRGGYWSYTYLYRLFLSRIIKKKPIFFYAPSMGPFTCKLDNIFRKLILARAGAIVLREAISASYLENQLGLKGIVTCDSALQNSISEDYLEKYDNLASTLSCVDKERTIGITITDLRWHPLHGKNPHLKNRIQVSLQETIEALVSRGYYILLIPQVFSEHSDVPLLEQYRDADKERILILPENVDSYGQQALMSRLHSVIGMRYHSNIFAAKAGIPFLCISYEHKMKGFMENLGLVDLTLDVEEITSQRIIEKFDYIEHNYTQIKKLLKERIPALQKLSGITTEIIASRIR